MEEQLISLETAKLAKEKGFDIKQKLRWIEILSNDSIFISKILNPDRKAVIEGKGKIKNMIPDPESLNKIGSIFRSNVTEEKEGINAGHYKEHGEAPTQSLLQKWLGEEHKIDINILKNVKHLSAFEKIHSYCSYLPFGDTPSGDKKTYEEALEKGLFEALKLIKEND